MGKGHYTGGGTLIGFGTLTKAKGRKGGLRSGGGAAVREANRQARKQKRKAEIEAARANQIAARKLKQVWAEENGRDLYERLVTERQIKSSPLAAALEAALKKATD